jgi:hypothetical protein
MVCHLQQDIDRARHLLCPTIGLNAKLVEFMLRGLVPSDASSIAFESFVSC